MHKAIQTALNKNRIGVMPRHGNLTNCEIKGLERDAIMALRQRVELDGMEWREALDEVLAHYPLGLRQIVEIETKAEERYGQK